MHFILFVSSAIFKWVFLVWQYDPCDMKVINSTNDPIADTASFVYWSRNYATVSTQLNTSQDWIAAEPAKGLVGPDSVSLYGSKSPPPW